MKNKSVCEETGLTDRAIRLYIDEKLIEPEITENYLGRKALNFRPEDVRQLMDIAVLRKFGFSIAQIRAIQNDPEAAGFILENTRQQKQELVNSQQKILNAIESVNIGSKCTVADLASALRTAKAEGFPSNNHPAEADVSGFLPLVVEILLLCVAIILGVLATILLTDMAVFYFSSGAFPLSSDGVKELISRSWTYIAGLIGFIALAVPFGYYAWILWRYGRNSKLPEITVRAVVIDKKSDADAVILSSFHSRNGGMIEKLVFRTEKRTVIELTVPQKYYYTTDIGTWGDLVYQGSKLVEFTPFTAKSE